MNRRWLGFRLGASLAIALLTGACGSEAALRVQLWRVSGDDPFANMATIEVSASVDNEVVQWERVRWAGRPVELEPIRRADAVELTVLGLRFDDTVLAKGRSTPNLPDRGESCCVAICFCTIAVFDAGGCTCGDDRCASACEPPP